MSTIVYQGFESCFEAQPTETTTLRLKLAAPKSVELENTNTKLFNQGKNPKLGGWNFLQSLSNPSQKSLDMDTFVPSLKLSQKSLELCTENLGSETGSDDSIDSGIFSNTGSDDSIDSGVFSNTITASKNTKPFTRIQNQEKKGNSSRSFPPPLTTISGSNCLHVRPHREGGRLVIEAVEAPSSRTCFEAERSNGRLQLRFVKNCEFFYDQKLSTEDDKEDESSEDNDKNTKPNAFEDERYGVEIKNEKEVDVEMGREKFQRHSSRCKGHSNGKELRNWEAFCVAT